MKNKIKGLVYTITSATLIFPALAVNATDYTAPTSTGLPTGSLTSIITNIMKWLLGLVGVIGVIGFAIAGILYLTAAGDETKMGTAKNAMLYSIIGVLVALGGMVALTFASGLLGGTASNF